MGLRLLLVGMVASLGIDLPNAHNLRDWAQSGRTWLCVQLDDWNAWVPSGDELCLTAPPRLPDPAAQAAAQAPQTTVEIINDEEFTAVLDEVVADFGPAKT